MQFAGLESFDELAARVDAPGYSARNLRNIAPPNDEPREVQKLHIVAIADATGLPIEFFTLSRDEIVRALRDVGEGREPRAQLEQRLGVIESALRRVLEVVPIPEPPVGLLPPHGAAEPTQRESQPPGTAEQGSQRGSGQS